MLITEKIAKRMLAARKLQAGCLKTMADVAKEAAVVHDRIATGNEKGQDTALDAMTATINFCHSSIEAATGIKPTLPEKHTLKGGDGKFAKHGSAGHLLGALLKRS